MLGGQLCYRPRRARRDSAGRPDLLAVGGRGDRAAAAGRPRLLAVQTSDFATLAAAVPAGCVGSRRIPVPCLCRPANHDGDKRRADHRHHPGRYSDRGLCPRREPAEPSASGRNRPLPDRCRYRGAERRCASALRSAANRGRFVDVPRGAGLGALFGAAASKTGRPPAPRVAAGGHSSGPDAARPGLGP